MTYCAGWKYKGIVFLIADTAVTRVAKPHTEYSSFGELHAEVQGEHVEESLLKLVPLGGGTVVAFAGDVQLATRCLDFLRDGLTTASSTREVLESLGKFPPDRVVELLVATSAEGGGCELLRWNSLHGIDPTEADWYQIGNLKSYHAALTPAFISRSVSDDRDVKWMLPSVCALVQSYGVHDNLIDMNVGGLIFGIQTTSGVVTWQKDTNYVLYGPNFASPRWITAIARDNAVVIGSSVTNDTRILAHSTSWLLGDVRQNEQWITSVIASLNSGRSPCWIFISVVGRVATVIIRSDENKDSRYVRLMDTGDGKFALGMSPELTAILCQPVENRRDEGVLVAKVNVLND